MLRKAGVKKIANFEHKFREFNQSPISRIGLQQNNNKFKIKLIYFNINFPITKSKNKAQTKFPLMT